MAGEKIPSNGDTNTIHAQVPQPTLTGISATTRPHQEADRNVTNYLRNETGPRRYGANANTVVATSSAKLDCCVICLDSISEPCTIRPCGHGHFDFLCLLSWLQQRASCPLCQSAVYKVVYPDGKNGGESVYRVPNAPRKHKDEERIRRRGETAPPLGRRAARDMRTGTGSRRLLGHPQQLAHRGAPRRAQIPEDALEKRCYIYRHLLYSLGMQTALNVVVGTGSNLHHVRRCRDKPGSSKHPTPDASPIRRHASPSLPSAHLDPARATSLSVPST